MYEIIWLTYFSHYSESLVLSKTSVLLSSRFPSVWEWWWWWWGGVGEVFSEQAYCPCARAKIDGKFQSLVRTPCCAAWPQNNIQAHTCKHTTRMPYFHVSHSACWCDDRGVVARRASRQSTAMKSCASGGNWVVCLGVNVITAPS